MVDFPRRERKEEGVQEKLVLARIGPDYLRIIGPTDLLFALVLLDFILVWRLRGDGGTPRWVG